VDASHASSDSSRPLPKAVGSSLGRFEGVLFLRHYVPLVLRHGSTFIESDAHLLSQ
jgi:hypothetical protein